MTSIGFRVLNSEVEELEEFEEDKQRFYDLKTFEMKEFKQNVENFKAECGGRVEELRVRVNEVKNEVLIKFCNAYCVLFVCSLFISMHISFDVHLGGCFTSQGFYYVAEMKL